MTVSVQTTFNAFTGNGVTTVFPYQFKILNSSDLQVYVGGVLKALGVDYTVSGVGVDVGGSVTFISGAPAAALAVSIIRAMAVRRTTDYQQLGDFLTPVVNPDFDNAILLIQDLQTQVGRSIRMPPDEVGTLPTLPSIANRAGKYLSFDPGGLPIGSSGTGNDSALRIDLANTALGVEGSRLVGFKRSDAGAIARSVYIEILDREVNLKDFGPAEDRVTDARGAFVNAFAACNPGDTLLIPRPATGYRISSEILVNKSNIFIKGMGSGGSGNGGAFKPVILFNSPNVGESCFRWSTYAENVRISNIGIDSKTAAKQHKLLRFFELHSSVIEECWLEGLGTAADDQTAILCDGLGLYTGACTFKDNYITNCKFGIDLQGSITTTRLIRNEFTGSLAGGVVGSFGIRLGASCVGVLVHGGNISQFETALFDDGVSTMTGGIYFERNTNNETHSATSTDCQISPSTYVTGPAPTYPITIAKRAMVWGRNTAFAGGCPIESGVGFRERGRTQNLGEWVTRAFAAGNFTANGAMTWTVSSDDVVTDAYQVAGKTMTYAFFLQTTVVGGAVNTDLQILIPDAYISAKRMRSASVHVLNNAVNSNGVVEATVGGNKLRVLKDVSSTNYVAGATEVYGQITFEVQ